MPKPLLRIMYRNLKRFASNHSKMVDPLSKGYWREIDTAPELNAKCAYCFQGFHLSFAYAGFANWTALIFLLLLQGCRVFSLVEEKGTSWPGIACLICIPEMVSANQLSMTSTTRSHCLTNLTPRNATGIILLVCSKLYHQVHLKSGSIIVQQGWFAWMNKASS